MIYLWEKEQEREIDRERERSEWMEDGGGQIGWVWGWSGVGWLSVAARSTTLSKRENKISVSRTSSVLGRSRMRSVLGGSVLGGDDLDGGTDELPTATMGTILSVLGATRPVLPVRSPCCFFLSLLFSSGVIHLKVK